jgi:hypothetical protein
VCVWGGYGLKIILRTKMNIPRSALLLELGWEPITAFIDRSKVSYFKRLSELPVSRLCKQVYNKMIMLNATFWNLAKYNLYRAFLEEDDNGIHTAHACVSDGLMTFFQSAFPKCTRLKSPCSPNIRIR